MNMLDSDLVDIGTN